MEIPSKEYYLKQIDNAIAEIEDLKESLLQDYDTEKIQQIEVTIELNPLELVQVIVNKTYIPKGEWNG